MCELELCRTLFGITLVIRNVVCVHDEDDCCGNDCVEMLKLCSLHFIEI